jgi:amino acid adenylation domain-containing protein
MSSVVRDKSGSIPLSEAKRKLLENYLKGKAHQAAPTASIQRRTGAGPAPLSYGQQQVWLHTQIAAGIPIYNEPVTVHRNGPLDVGSLERSLSEILRRHEAWRTSFQVVSGELMQIVHPPPAITLPVADLSAVPPAEREPEALRLAAEEARRPFDLTRAPLVRFKLIRLSALEHRLLVTLHHLVFDGVSVYQVFLPELASLYEAYSTGKSSPLSEPPIQYADYAHWQRTSLGQEALSEHMDYWGRQLSGDLPALQLPTDSPRPAIQSFRGDIQWVDISKDLTDRLRALSQREKATMYMTLLAAFTVLLHRYTGQDDIVVGGFTAGRKQPELQKMIGFFLNTVVLRTNLSGNPTFCELLGRVRETVLGALAHDEMPFEHVVRELQPHRDLSRNPLVQVVFSLEPPLAAPNPTWDMTQWDVGTGAAKFELSFLLDERPDGIVGRITYNKDLFEAATIDRMLGHWQILLASIVADPTQRLSELPILTEPEQHQMLVEWNQTRAEFPSQSLLHELVETQVEATPQAVAVSFEAERVTYGELNALANQLAHHLRSLGVGPETPVGICLERSINMAVAVLGVLKAGGAYLPLDPTWPKDRLMFMLGDAQAPVLLTEQRLAGWFLNSVAHTVCLDSDWKAISKAQRENPPRATGPDKLAYVIYTSGSTGKPKGVQIPHRAVINLLTDMRSRLHVTGQDNFLFLTTLSFDIAGLELFLPLTMGAHVTLVSHEIATDGAGLSRAVAAAGVTVMQATPATWQMLLDVNWKGDSRLKILCGGEALKPELAKQLSHRCATLWNVYGPTETTIWSTALEVSTVPVHSAAAVSIGRPIANTEIYLLDSASHPVPIGVPGELHIGGAGLARGYLNQPELTEQKFIPHPFSTEPGARLYRTGDLARYRADGNIEFLSRTDHQVKIRGFRIEPGEIEAALVQCPGIRAAAVMAREDAAGEKRLIAYIVAPEQEVTRESLRRCLRERLPDYMVPSAFILMDALPLTSNGKLNRQALPAPEAANPDGSARSRKPKDAVELQLTHIWERVLGVTGIAVTDNFFDLGGHSLSAVRLFSEIEKTFGEAPPLAALYVAPTIEQLGTAIRQKGFLRGSSLVPVRLQGSKPPLFLIRGLPIDVLLYYDLAQHLNGDRPIYLLDAEVSKDPQTVEQIAASYVREMRAVQPEGPYYLAGACFAGVVAFEMAKQLAEAGQQVALVVLMDSFRPRLYQALPLRRRINYQARRVKVHSRELWRLDRKTRAAYARQKADDLRMLWKRRIYSIGFSVSRGMKHPLPPKLVDPNELNLWADEQYVPSTYSGHVILFRAMEQGLLPDFPQDLGWSDFVTGKFQVFDTPGDHATMLKPPHVQVLAAKLDACLSEGQA